MAKRSSFIHFMTLSLYLQRKFILWSAIGFGLIFLLTANVGPNFSPLYHLGLFLGGALISIHAFREIHDKGANIQYLTLPVSAWSRYLVLWLLTGPLYLLFITALYGLGVAVHMLMHNYWGSGDVTALLYTTGQYLVINAIFLLGSVTFKRLPLIKTLLCLLLLGLILAILRGVLGNTGLSSDVILIGSDMLWGLLGVGAWTFAYQKLKKSELR